MTKPSKATKAATTGKRARPAEHPESAGEARAAKPRFTKGGAPGPGRPKGSLNQSTVAFMEAIAAVYHDLQAEAGGGHAHFLNWARANATEYYRIAARRLPLRVEASGAIGVVVFRGIHDHL